MSDPIYNLPEQPEYHDAIRKLQNNDLVDADGVLNPLIEAMLENTHFVRLLAQTIAEQNAEDHAAIRQETTDAIQEAVTNKQEKLSGTAGQVLGFDAQGNPVPQGTESLRGPKGNTGPYFTPTVNAAGDMSWSNNGGLPNPPSVNIRGPAGTDGANGKDGAPGAPGKDGAAGANGATFTPSVSQDGTLSWTNNGGFVNPSPVNIRGPEGSYNYADISFTNGVPRAIGKYGNYTIYKVFWGSVSSAKIQTNIKASYIFEFKVIGAKSGGVEITQFFDLTADSKCSYDSNPMSSREGYIDITFPDNFSTYWGMDVVLTYAR